MRELAAKRERGGKELVIDGGRIAICVVSYERGRLTRRLLESVERSTGVPHDLWLADNGSESGDVGALLVESESVFGAKVVRLPRNLGPSAGRNELLKRLTQGSIRYSSVAFLDNDVVLLPGWAEAALEALSSGYDAVQPKLLTIDARVVDRGPTRAWSVDYLVHPEYLGRGAPRFSPGVAERMEVPVFGGTAVLSWRLVQAVGSFDESIWIGEDYDYAYRAAGAGFRFCYEPCCEMIHDHAYEPKYDNVRGDPKKALEAHVAMWRKHGRLLLPPSAVWLYQRILELGEDVVLDRSRSVRGIARRIRRMWLKRFSAFRFGEVWETRQQGGEATSTLIRFLAEHQDA